MTDLRVAAESDWTGRSADPNDEQFGDVVGRCGPDDLDDHDVVVLGEPYDGAVLGRPGAGAGPRALRDALADVTTHHFDAGPVGSDASGAANSAGGAAARIGDLGDLSMPDGDVREAQATARAAARQLHESDALPVFLGGDNSLTYPNAAPLLDEGLGCLNLDAHLDVREVRDAPTSGTPYRQLHGEGLDAYACVGARHFETSTAYHDYVREHGGAVVTAEEVGADPVAAADRALDALAGVDAVYVSVDLDVLDAPAAPGVSAPTPGGITTRELYRLLRLVAADERVAGFEVVECAPPLDRDDRTARAGARAVAHFLAGQFAGGDTRGVPGGDDG